MNVFGCVFNFDNIYSVLIVDDAKCAFPNANYARVQRRLFHAHLALTALHNAFYARGDNLWSISCQFTVRLPEVTKNANFALTMPFVQEENAIYADNAICAYYAMPFVHTMPIVRTMPFVHAAQCQLCIWCTIGIVAHLAL